MTVIKLKYNFLVFLYAYLRQIDSSLDRSRWGSIEELREYYNIQIAPEHIVNYLMQKYDINDELEKSYFD